jgi:hypothetical protein
MGYEKLFHLSAPTTPRQLNVSKRMERIVIHLNIFRRTAAVVIRFLAQDLTG